MLTSFFRTVILLIIIVIAVRIMGKRQIGQLQPAELVVTILLSEIAATPMQDNDIPMLNSVVAILVLVALEIIMSALSLKSIKIRGVLQGNSVILIKDGEIQQNQMKRLRFTLDDLLEALRQKDVFDVSDVQYAIAETDGSLSVLLKPGKRTVTAEDMKLDVCDTGLPCVTVMDGSIIRSEFSSELMDDEKMEKIIRKAGIDVKDIFLMTVDRRGKTTIVKKEGKK